jgi:hypothetical protein
MAIDKSAMGTVVIHNLEYWWIQLHNLEIAMMAGNVAVFLRIGEGDMTGGFSPDRINTRSIKNMLSAG